VPELQIVRGRKSEPHSCLVRGRVKGTKGVRRPTAFLHHFSSRAPPMLLFKWYISTVYNARPPGPPAAANALSATASSLPLPPSLLPPLPPPPLP
jgi:hypothetical protein